MYSNFGELGVEIKKLVDEYQAKSEGNQKKLNLLKILRNLLMHFQNLKRWLVM